MDPRTRATQISSFLTITLKKGIPIKLKCMTKGEVTVMSQQGFREEKDVTNSHSSELPDIKYTITAA